MKRRIIRAKSRAGYGARKKHRGKGHKGGKGKSGSGKRADQKKTKFLIGRQRGKKRIFGKHGFTSRKKVKSAKKFKTINLREISEKFSGKNKIQLKNYKILAEGEIKDKFTIEAKAASKSAIEKIKKAGGEIIIKSKKRKVIKKRKETAKKGEGEPNKQEATDIKVTDSGIKEDIETKKIKSENEIENKKEEIKDGF